MYISKLERVCLLEGKRYRDVSFCEEGGGDDSGACVCLHFYLFCLWRFWKVITNIKKCNFANKAEERNKKLITTQHIEKR